MQTTSQILKLINGRKSRSARCNAEFCRKRKMRNLCQHREETKHLMWEKIILQRVERSGLNSITDFKLHFLLQMFPFEKCLMQRIHNFRPSHRDWRRFIREKQIKHQWEVCRRWNSKATIANRYHVERWIRLRGTSFSAKWACNNYRFVVTSIIPGTRILRSIITPTDVLIAIRIHCSTHRCKIERTEHKQQMRQLR